MALLSRRRRDAAPSVSLAGAGAIAVVHALAAQGAGMTLRAVASAGGRSARHLAGELDARRVAVDQLPDGADLLVVATPPRSHVELALAGLDAGATVLVEKPLATTLADADRLAQHPSSVRARVAENLLHAPAWRALVERRPSLGTLGHLSVATLQPAPNWGHFTGPLLDGGVLFDLGPHALSLAMACAAEPLERVSATLSSSRDDGADDDAHVELHFESGLCAQIHVSWAHDDTTWQLQAAGESGVLRLELLPEVVLEHNGDPVTVPDRHRSADPALERFGYIDQLLDTASGSPVGQSVAQGREVLEVICAAYASARSGRDEPVPFSGDRFATPMQLWRG